MTEAMVTLARILKYLSRLGTLTHLIPLAGYAYVGSFMRYSGDDYCYGASITQRGLWSTSWFAYFHEVPFSGNRFTVNLITGAATLLPPHMMGFLPGLAIFAWLLSVALLVKGLARGPNRPAWVGLSSMISAFVVFMTIYLAPDMKQSLYWAAGLLAYLTPLITLTLLAALLVRAASYTRPALTLLSTIGALSLVSAGFSETTLALQVASLSLAYLALMVIRRTTLRDFGDMSRLLLVALIAGLIGAGIQLASPASRIRQAKIGLPSDPLITVLDSLRHASQFIEGSINGQPIPVLMVLMFFTLVGIFHLFQSERRPTVSARMAIAGGLVLAMIGYLLIAASMMPSAYAQRSNPELRALIATRYVWVLMLAGIGYCFGRCLGSLLDSFSSGRVAIQLIPAFLYVGVALYPLRPSVIRPILADISLFAEWAEAWDARDTRIRSLKAAGETDLVVQGLYSVIPRVAELQEDAGYWYNKCAAGYYDVDSIAAEG